MPCSFNLDRLQRLGLIGEKYSGLGTGCQFNVAEEELYVASPHVKLCKFHVSQQPAHQEQWHIDPEEVNEHLFAFVDTARNAGRIADLSGVQVPGAISFERYTGDMDSLPDVLFVNAVFSGKASFRGTAFSGIANFHGARFLGGADFSGANFSETASFRVSDFQHGVNFDGAEFSAFANFVNATLSGPDRDVTVFSDSKFATGADFSGARFIDGADFLDVQFSGDANFTETQFSAATFFVMVTFEKDALFRAARFDSLATFRRATFGGRARFSDLRFVDTTDFSDAIFNVAPEFHGCELHQDTSFAHAEFRDHRGRPHTDAARAYRTLKLAMEQVRATREQALFFRHEQRSLRLRSDTPRSIKMISWLYEVTSDYGESPIRPLIGLGATFIVFFLFYFAIQTSGKPVLTWADSGDSLFFTAQQVFVPFRVFLSNPREPLGLILLTALHSILNVGFITLFIIALRRKFRLV